MMERMERLKILVSTERRKVTMVILLWGLGIASTFAQGLYQRAYLTSFDYALVFSICLLGGAIIIDAGKAILAFGAAMVIGMTLLVTMLTLPLAGTIPPPGDIFVGSLWVTIIFSAVFPFPFLGLIVSTAIGSFLGEKYL